MERAAVELVYPAYTERPPETVDALTLTVPEGTELAWSLTLDRPVSAAELRSAILGSAVQAEAEADDDAAQELEPEPGE